MVLTLTAPLSLCSRSPACAQLPADAPGAGQLGDRRLIGARLFDRVSQANIARDDALARAESVPRDQRLSSA
jgi:hypothetical protein